MKRLILLFSVTFTLSANCQDLAKQLQKQMWYVNGYILRGQACEIYHNKPTNCSGYLIFNNIGELEMHLTETDTKFACLYEVQNDKLKLHYDITFTATKKTEEVNLFYKLKELPGGRDYELLPIAEAEYK